MPLQPALASSLVQILQARNSHGQMQFMPSASLVGMAHGTGEHEGNEDPLGHVSRLCTYYIKGAYLEMQDNLMKKRRKRTLRDQLKRSIFCNQQKRG